MQASWTKIDGRWCVRIAGNLGQATGRSGEQVTVVARSGRSKQVTLGAQVKAWNAGRTAIYAAAAETEARYDARSHKQRHGRCEDAPCCGCCGGWQEAESSAFIYG